MSLRLPRRVHERMKDLARERGPRLADFYTQTVELRSAPLQAAVRPHAVSPRISTTSGEVSTIVGAFGRLRSSLTTPQSLMLNTAKRPPHISDNLP